MEHWLTRTELLLGEQKLQRLKDARVVILGLGGVGSAAAEAICRSGVGHMMLVDKDTVSLTNINRQLVATTATIGQYKTTALAERLRTINPEVQITCREEFVLPDNNQFIWDYQPDYIVDCIDTITAKLFIAQEACQREIKLISSMGAGGRVDPTKLRLGDIADTSGTSCALSRVMRRELKKRNVPKLDVVYSLETPAKITVGEENGRHPPTSCAFVPPAAGLCLASFVISRL